MKKPYDKNNVFYKIIQGEILCEKILESKFSLSFKDIKPHAPIHILILPKGQYVEILDFQKNASIEEQNDFWEMVDDISKKFGVDKTSFRVVSNIGSPLQEVFHFHLHLLSGIVA